MGPYRGAEKCPAFVPGASERANSPPSGDGTMQGTAMAIDRAKLIRIAKILPLLNSDKPGEQQAAAEALASSTCGTLLLCCSLHCHRPPLAIATTRGTPGQVSDQRKTGIFGTASKGPTGTTSVQSTNSCAATTETSSRLSGLLRDRLHDQCVAERRPTSMS